MSIRGRKDECGKCGGRFCPRFAADATGFEPAAYASGDQCTSDFRPGFPRSSHSDECAGARESVPICATVGFVIPAPIVQVAWAVLEDPRATEREVKLARWALLSILKESGAG
jgi:hypothetical protein